MLARHGKVWHCVRLRTRFQEKNGSGAWFTDDVSNNGSRDKACFVPALFNLL
jgi:hypothetical protein